MSSPSFKELLDAGVHLGHITRRWNPKMEKYIFMERNGIHILDLNKTSQRIDEAAKAMKHLVKTGRKILFIGTKKQAKFVVKEQAQRVDMPFVTERWLGGMLTNFSTVRKSIKKMTNIEKFTKEAAYKNLSKKEKLMLARNHTKLEVLFQGIADLTRIPVAVFIVDVKKEHIAQAEALRLNIPIFGIVDTNADPTNVDYPIPANDESAKSIELIIKTMTDAIAEGLEERKRDKEHAKEAELASKEEKQSKKKGKEVEATAEGEEGEAKEKKADAKKGAPKTAEKKTVAKKYLIK